MVQRLPGAGRTSPRLVQKLPGTVEPLHAVVERFPGAVQKFPGVVEMYPGVGQQLRRTRNQPIRTAKMLLSYRPTRYTE